MTITELVAIAIYTAWRRNKVQPAWSNLSDARRQQWFWAAEAAIRELAALGVPVELAA